jgi:glutamate-1-semialdehyde 2,1-aminomutase
MSMVAGFETMRLMTPAAFDRLDALGERMREGLRAALKDAGVAGHVAGVASFAILTLGDRPVGNYRDLAETARFAPARDALHRFLLNHGVLASPQIGFTLSTAMGEDEIDFAVEQVRGALAGL